MKLGIKNIFFIHRQFITLPFINYKAKIELPINIHKQQIPITHLSAELNSNSQHDKNGLLYTVNVSALLPYNHDNELLILHIIQGNYIFLVEDMNRNKYLVGSNHYRANLASKHIIDKLNKNIIQLEISHISPHGEIIII